MKALLIVVSLGACLGMGYLASAMITPKAHKTAVKSQDRFAQAIDQAHDLYAALAAVNFNPALADKNLQFLPDQDFSEDPQFHDNHTSAFSIPRWEGYQNRVAFYTEIFVQMHRDAPVGDSVAVHPTGDYIVCKWDGTVQTVPISDVRFAPATGPSGDKRSYPVFPGMPQYATADKLW